MSKKKILLIDKDLEHVNKTKSILEKEGYLVDTSSSMISALKKQNQASYDLIISELWLSEINGIQGFQLLKLENPNVRFFIHTSEPDQKYELEALNAGVHKFISKTKIWNILTKEIELVFETAKAASKVVRSTVENIELDIKKRKIFKSGEEKKLTRKEYDLLVFLIKNKNRALSRKEILKKVWKCEQVNKIRIIDTTIKNIRAKLNIISLVTISGIGYIWDEEY
ncbi:MAG: response regulator transcription factor [Culicoidibacterales bacterium]